MIDYTLINSFDSTSAVDIVYNKHNQANDLYFSVLLKKTLEAVEKLNADDSPQVTVNMPLCNYLVFARMEERGFKIDCNYLDKWVEITITFSKIF